MRLMEVGSEGREPRVYATIACKKVLDLDFGKGT